MKCIGFGIGCIVLLWACSGGKNFASMASSSTISQNDSVRIANDSLEYEVIIIEPGFNTWLNGSARARGYYSEEFLENRNRIWSQEWNRRVLQPQQFNPNWYEMQINYDPTLHYGYEVNYIIYNYFIYFQLQYKQRLGVFEVRP